MDSTGDPNITVAQIARQLRRDAQHLEETAVGFERVGAFTVAGMYWEYATHIHALARGFERTSALDAPT